MRYIESVVRLVISLLLLAGTGCSSSSDDASGAGAGYPNAAGAMSAAGQDSGSAGTDPGSDSAGDTGSAGSQGTAGGTSPGASGSGGSAAGGVGGAVGVAGSEPSASEQFAPIASAFCAAARTCCSEQHVETTLTDCETEFATRQSALASVDKGSVAVDRAALAKCSAAYQQAAANCDQSALLSACNGVFLGTKAAGEACSNVYECARTAGPMVCLFANDATIGVCKRVPQGKAGDACLGSCPAGEDCSSVTAGTSDTNLTLCFEQDGLYCDTSSSNPLCKSLIAAGDNCTSDDACGSARLCDTTCQARGSLNAACGAGCLRELTCGNDDKCHAPSLANGGVCSGYPPAP